MVLSYMSVKQKAKAEIIEKKSRFIASIAPVSTEEEALSFVDNVRQNYKDATHNCMAYRVGLNTVSERRSDDGEPSGTAGPPMLEVLRKENLTNVAVVVTRYFGGILLGGGGLVRAYSSSCAAAVREAGVVEKRLMQNMTVTVDYSLSGKLQYEIAGREFNGREFSGREFSGQEHSGREFILYDTVYEKDVTFCLWVPVSLDEWAEDFFTQLASGNLRVKRLGTEYI